MKAALRLAESRKNNKDEEEEEQMGISMGNSSTFYGIGSKP